MSTEAKSAMQELREEFKQEVTKAKAEAKEGKKGGGGGGDAVYGIGLIGAWIYFIGRGETTSDKVIGFFKGFVWPAFLVLAAFKALDKK